MSREIATLGAGCFWCVEAIFDSLKGVSYVQSGYSGGEIINPSYKEVCTGRTGHAEVIEIEFDNEVISFAKLLEIFWQVHDPTTKDRQGNDVGTQYRSAIFYHNETQKETAELSKKAADEAGIYPNPIVTEISKIKNFFRAEDYHNDYFELNGNQPYCRAVVRPKVEKFQAKFSELLSQKEGEL